MNANVLHISSTAESGIGEEKGEEKTASATEIEGLTEQAHKQFQHFVKGAHEMTACALAAIDACSADVPQTSQLLKLLVRTPSQLLIFLN